MIPKNKRHLIVNKEYSRLPYWTDDGYDDVQKQVSQKYVQDSFGKFAESENQPPYLSDADYQGLEYEYQDPQFPDIPDLNKDTAPKGTCYQLWLSLFGDATGAFIPTASEWNKLNEYAKKCPLIYMPHICCLGMKINGPSSLAPGGEANYTVSGGDVGCAYDMKASGGEFVGSKYFAPTTPGTYEIYVTPWMSSDQGKKCAKKTVTVVSESGCKGVIGYTTLQMSTSASQTLTVTGGDVGDTYTWTTTSGSFDTDTGTLVVYTAPASNANCTSNPTITLTCGGNVVDTLQISVNAYTNMGKVAFRQICTGGPAYNTSNCDNQGEYPICYVAFRIYDCLGRDMRALNGYPDPTCSIAMYEAQQGGPDWCINSACADVDPGTPGCSCGWVEGVLYDVRTPDMITGGCCPAALL